MGGEKILEPSMGVGNFGSPPRGRGKAVKFRCTCGLQRITPAQAGKRVARGGSSSSSWDHPRIGGEKILEPSMGVGNFGSPPRWRGKDRPEIVRVTGDRITPAQAGKSDRRRPSPLGGWDHPRTGGEKSTGLDATSETIGSPPHGRGKAHRANKLVV